MNFWKPLQPTASGSEGANGTARPASGSSSARVGGHTASVSSSSSGPASLVSFRPLVPASGPPGPRPAVPGAGPSAAYSRPTNPPIPPRAIDRILAHLPVPDIPAFARTCRAFGRAARDGGGDGWRVRWEAARGEGEGEGEVRVRSSGQGAGEAQGAVEGGGKETGQPSKAGGGATATKKPPGKPAPAPAPLVIEDDDEFGDFSSQSLTRLALGGDNGPALDADGFGVFAAGPSAPRAVPAGGGSLLDLDFEDAQVPLPSSPTGGRRTSSSAAHGPGANGHARRTSGFFALSEKGLASLPPARDAAGSGAVAPSRPTPERDYLALYRAHHTALLPLVRAIRNNTSTSSSTHLLSLLLSHIPATAAAPAPSLAAQADLIIRLLRFLSPAVQPTKDWGWLRMTLVRGGIADRFEGMCLSAFEKAEERIHRRRAGGNAAAANDFTREEDAADMARVKEAAQASWRVYSAANASKLAEAGAPTRTGGRSARALLGGSTRSGDEARREARRRMAEEWELGRVWVEKKEVFYEGNKWDSMANIV